VPGSKKIRKDVSIPAYRSEWDIGSYLRYEHERPDVVSLTSDWEGDVPSQSVSAVLQVLRGDYPDAVYLAEMPKPGGWTRKLKLFVPGQQDRVMTVIGGGTPRLWLGNEVGYQLPNPRVKYTSMLYRHAPAENNLVSEKIVSEEAQGGLALPQSKHIQERVAQALALTGDSMAIPTLTARGRFNIPEWEGAFLAYSEAINYRPASYLRSEVGHQGLDRGGGVEVFRSGVRSLFQTLKKINIREGGMFHGDLVHRVHGGSANVGFTLEGTAVLKGWGRREDEQVQEWSARNFRRHQMREVTGALAGLLYDILDSDLGREDRWRLMVDIVGSGLEAYTGRQGMIDRIELTSGLPTDMDRLRKARREILDDYDMRDYQDEVILHQESGQLPDEIRSWLVQCVIRLV
jgi:hypothetical protein